jgi:hypothetical protein
MLAAYSKAVAAHGADDEIVSSAQRDVDARAGHGSFRPPLRNLRARARAGVSFPDHPV